MQSRSRHSSWQQQRGSNMIDNEHFDITANGNAFLRKVIPLVWAFGDRLHLQATHWKEMRLKQKEDYKYGEWLEERPDGTSTLLIFWSDVDNIGLNKLVTPLGVKPITSMVQAWLKKADRGIQPDHDGHNTPTAWRVFVPQHIGYTIFAVQAHWAMYGK
jgi:hypothetical protein